VWIDLLWIYNPSSSLKLIFHFLDTESLKFLI
jgi:hypothetical protein